MSNSREAPQDPWALDTRVVCTSILETARGGATGVVTEHDGSALIFVTWDNRPGVGEWIWREDADFVLKPLCVKKEA